MDNNKIIKYFLTLLSVLITLYLALNYCFMSKKNSIKVLQSDDDNFLQRLTPIDLIARHIDTVKNYKIAIFNAIYEPLLIDKLTILFCIYKIRNMTGSCDWVDNKKFHMMPWSIIMVKNNIYENNFPHTRFSSIIINNNSMRNIDQLTETLLHEQLHVYQKLYGVDEYVNKHYKKVTIDKTLCRTNPDTNEYTYMDKNNLIYSCKYNSLNPKSLADAIYTPNNVPKYDHPYEKMVYDLVAITV